MTELPVLRADCTRCVGLCCVALPFTASSDFATDKDAGTPCRHLQPDDRCGIHDRLRAEGFRGCTVFDCFGAGQRVTAAFGGRNWRDDAATAGEMFSAFAVLRALHELLWHLAQALALPSAVPVHADLRSAQEEVQAAAAGAAGAAGGDVAALRARVGPLLEQASAAARAALAGPRRELRGADLVGARLDGADLRAADLRGALLIAADCTGADLRGADLLGADLRDTRLHGADLTDALFLTQPQLDAAVGDRTTRLPGELTRPVSWR